MPNLPLVAIVGRPNVGKSSLFNRLIGQRRSIVTDEPGITRDRIYGTVSWSGRAFELVDTGGIVPGEESEIPRKIFEQAEVAIEAASVLFFVVDGRTSSTAADLELSKLLRRTAKPVYVIVNKIDSDRQDSEVAEFHRLGFRNVFPISAEHGRGITELLDSVLADLPVLAEPDPLDEIRVAIIGRPNVGKSTLLNSITGQQRSMVSPVAGTTRDAVDSVLEVGGRRFRFIDTAGIRRKGKTELRAEKLSVIMARRHLERSDVALLIVDGVQGIQSLDATIGGYAHEAGRSVIIVVNKWDAVEKHAAITAEVEKTIRERMKFLAYAPIAFISARTRQRVDRLFPLIADVTDGRHQRVPTAELNEFLRDDVLRRGGLPADVRIRFVTQVKTNPPTFVVFSNKYRKFHFSLERFIENRIRERYPFSGTPIIIKQRLKVRDATSGKGRKGAESVGA